MRVIKFFVLASIAIAALTSATPDYTLLDQACGVVSRPADCPRLKNVPGLPTGVLQTQSSIGCVASNNQCIFSRSIQCRHDGVGQILGEALEAFVTCSSSTSFNGCPVECIPAASQLKAMQYVLANLDITKFTSAQSADAFIVNHLVDQTDNVQQILICTADSMAVLKQRRLQDLTRWWRETSPAGIESQVGDCAALEWASIQTAYSAAKAKQNAIAAAAATVGPTAMTTAPAAGAPGPAVSSAPAFGRVSMAISLAAFLFAAVAVM